MSTSLLAPLNGLILIKDSALLSKHQVPMFSYIFNKINNSGGYKSLDEGQKVQFSVTQGQKGRKLKM